MKSSILMLLIILLANKNVESYNWGYPYYGGGYYGGYRPFKMFGTNFNGIGAVLSGKKK
uniref:Uncharacterized protein n=1 Tax=Wuchereria bancrofti TaxID=6293 RepID=A0AAF5RVP8_WUCBA